MPLFKNKFLVILLVILVATGSFVGLILLTGNQNVIRVHEEVNTGNDVISLDAQAYPFIVTPDGKAENLSSGTPFSAVYQNGNPISGLGANITWLLHAKYMSTTELKNNVSVSVSVHIELGCPIDDNIFSDTKVYRYTGISAILNNVTASWDIVEKLATWYKEKGKSAGYVAGSDINFKITVSISANGADKYGVSWSANKDISPLISGTVQYYPPGADVSLPSGSSGQDSLVLNPDTTITAYSAFGASGGLTFIFLGIGVSAFIIVLMWGGLIGKKAKKTRKRR